jgi:glycosyltransferase involved in cell wall biosynthesis
MTPRVLFVAPNLPYPLVSGGHLRDWQLLNLLARLGIRPTLLYFGAGEERLLDGRDPVSALCTSVRYGGARVERPDATRGQTLRRKLAYLVGGRQGEHPFAYQYDAMRAGDVILREAARAAAEIVVLRGFWCHHAARLRAAGHRVIANCPDANVRLAREMVRSVRSPLQKLGPFCNLRGVQRQERRLADCDEIWAPTALERDELASLGGTARVLEVPNLVDVEAYPDLAGEPGADDTLLFVGNFAYGPNANAARVLLTDVLPAVRREMAATCLLLVGGGMPDDLQRLVATAAGVEAPGFVDDLLPWYRRAGVVVLPVREGAGMLFKTVEALAYGKAAVGVPHAFRGLEAAGDPGPFVMARTGAALVASTVGMLRDREGRAALARRARAFAETRLSWNYGLRCLEHSLLVEG